MLQWQHDFTVVLSEDCYILCVSMFLLIVLSQITTFTHTTPKE